MKIKDEAVAGIVAGAAFVASAEHIIHVVTTTGGSTYTGWTYPLGIDGLVYVGIMAARRGRRTAGLLAIAIGAAYSLAFNADALSAFQLPRLVIAASMPVCMLAAFVIVHSGHRDVVAETVVAVEPIVQSDADVVDVESVPVPSVPVIESKPVRPSGTGRAPAWDVDKCVQLIKDGRGNEEIGDALGISYKPVQRTRRVLGLIQSGDAVVQSDELIAKTCGVSAAHVAKVRAAVAQ